MEQSAALGRRKLERAAALRGKRRFQLPQQGQELRQEWECREEQAVQARRGNSTAEREQEQQEELQEQQEDSAMQEVWEGWEQVGRRTRSLRRAT